MKKIIIGTNNLGKISEVKKFLPDLKVEWLTLSQIGSKIEIVEDGKTFSDNALKKAITIANKTNIPTIAADGGMTVPALGGWPGVRSRRFETEIDHSDQEIVDIFQKRTANLDNKDRQFEFVTVFAFSLPGSNDAVLGTGHLKGEITKQPYSAAPSGFPYRLFWWIPKYNKHFLDLNELEYDQINHNAQAIRRLRPVIERYLND